VLDYKTSEVLRDGALGARIAGYHPQVAAYAAALRGKLPGGAATAPTSRAGLFHDVVPDYIMEQARGRGTEPLRASPPSLARFGSGWQVHDLG